MHPARALLLALACVTASGCAINQGLEPGNESGLVTNTQGESFNAPMSPAWIYELDGEPVAYTKRSHRLSAGKHTIRVWPIDSAPQGQVMVPDTTMIFRDKIEVEALEFTVKPGYRYYFAARTNITQTTATTAGVERYEFEKQKFIVPAIVSIVEPVELEEAAKGLGAFFGLLALGPLLGAALF